MEMYFLKLLAGSFGWGLLFIFFMWMIKKPTKRNYLVGYRTLNAMKSEVAFKLANDLFYSYLKKLCFVLLLIGVLKTFIVSSIDQSLIAGIITFALGFTYIIVKVERRIKSV